MMFLTGLVLGAAICSLPYVVYAAEFPPLVITMIALALAAAGLAVARPADRWLSGAGVGAGIVVPIIVTIVLDFRRDPTSHNLAPFEILIGLAVGMPPALVGALVGGLMNRVGLRRPLVGGTIAALGLAAAALHAQVMLARTVASESGALARIRALRDAQTRFRTANPARGFSCDLNDLGESFDAAARRYPPSIPVAGVYRVGMYAPAGDYDFWLYCTNEVTPATAFALFAMARQNGLGRWVYCAEADGRLREIGRRRYNFCFTDGQPVPD
jgi:hypothetical protein